MKRKLMCLLLSVVMVLSMLPAAGAVDMADSTPNEFSQSVALPLMGARMSGLYDEAAIPLPDPEGTAFLSRVEGWSPCMPEEGVLPLTVSTPDQNAVKVSNAAELKNLTEGGSYVLTQDIDLTDLSWTPLTITGTTPFVLDGQGHTIKGMSVSADGSDYTGLFGKVSPDMTVKNLRFDGATLSTNIPSVSGEFYYGAFVSRAEKTVTLENFVADDLHIVRKGAKVGALGGLFGRVIGRLTVTDCAVDITISKSDDTVEESYGMVMGGLAARISNCELTRVFGRVEVDGQGLSWRDSQSWEGIGGLIGYAASTKTVSVFRDCMLAGNIDAGMARAGGLLAYAAGPVQMENCVALADLTAKNLGGLASYVGAGFQVTDCRYAGSLCAHGSTSFVGGLAGTATGSTVPTTIVNCAVKADICAPDAGTEGMNAYVGGLFGRVTSFSMQSCSAKTTLSGFDGDALYLGGLVGDTQNSADRIRDCCADISSSEAIAPADANVGGLVGHCNNISFANCGAKVDLSIYAPGEIGGLIGYNENVSQLLKCWSSGQLTIVATGAIRAGGLVGFPSYDDGKITIGQCYSGTDLDTSGCRNINEEIGGLVGSGSSTIYSSWCNASIVGGYDEPDSVDSSAIAGLVGSGTSSLRDCCFLGEVRAELLKDVGGLTGYGNATISNCYAKCSLSGGYYMGGILARTFGTSGKTQISDCWFEGRLLEPDDIKVLAAGGIAGQVSSGSIQRCSANASLYATYGKVGGILADGSVSVAEDCSFTGSLTGKTVSGIAAAATSIYDCTVNAAFDISDSGNGYVKVGGIAIKSALIQNCHVENTISIHQYADEDAAFGTYYIGGIAAEGSKVVDCSSKGIYYRCTTASKSLHGMWVGGIVGRDSCGIENCRVDGNVYVKVGHAGLDIGGLVGGMEYYFAKNSSVSGDVIAEFESGSCCAGGLIGSATKSTILDCCYHTGSVHAWCSDEDARIYTATPWVGDGDYTEANAPNLNRPDRPGEEYVILAYGHRDDSPYNYFPLVGASVSMDGKAIGTTGTDGSLHITNEDAGSIRTVTLLVEKEGYFTAERAVLLAHNGAISVFLRERIPGRIYLTSARVDTEDGLARELIGTNNSIRIPHTETQLREMYFGVDWNDLQADGRTLMLTNEDGSHTVGLGRGNSTIRMRLADVFDPGEDIYLRATALDAAGSERKEEILLPLKVQLIPPAISLATKQFSVEDENGKEGLDFLSGLKFGFELDNLWNHGANFTYENNVARVAFSGTAVPLFKSKMFGTEGKITVEGAIQAAGKSIYTPWEDLEWSGSLGGAIKLDPAFEHSSPIVYKPPTAYAVKIDAEASFDIKVDGTVGKPEVTGTGDIKAGFNTIGGLGFAIPKEAHVIGGPELGASGGLSGSIGTKSTSVEQVGEAWVEGVLSLAVDIKSGDIEFDPGFQLGRFRWTSKDGTKFYGLGESDDSNSPVGVENSVLTWMPSTQSYLATGGGFRGAEVMPEQAVLNSWNSSVIQPDTAQLYENIGRNSSSALTVENGSTVLYFTANDKTGYTDDSAARHTALWRTVRMGDGSWTEPVCVSGADQGYPDIPHANGPFAVWVNSSETGSLEQLLTTTDIHIAREGVLFHTIDGGGYVTDVTVSASTDGSQALVTWLSDTSVVDLDTFFSQMPTLHYALYNGSIWTQGTVDTNGLTPVSAWPDLAAKRIYWQTPEGILYFSSGSSYQTATELLSDTEAVSCAGTYTMTMAQNGSLDIWNGDELVASLSTGGSSLLDSVLLHEGSGGYTAVWVQSDGVYSAAATDDWAVKCVSAQDQAVRGLSAVLIDGRPLVSFYCSEYGDGDELIQHLCTARAPDLNGSDLALTELICDTADLTTAGLLKLVGTVTNLRNDPVTGYTYSVTDEDGQSVFSGSVDTLSLGYGDTHQCHAVFIPDVTKAHTYTFTIIPATEDEDNFNHAQSISPASAAELVSATFIPTSEGGTGLEVLVGNAGTAPTGALTVEIFCANQLGQTTGDALAAATFDQILSGSYRQLILPTADSDVYYSAVLSSGEKILDRRLLMYSDPQRTGAWITAARVEEDGTAQITLEARELDESVQVLLALYESVDDRMVFLNAATLAAWKGTKDAEFDFTSQLDAGNYRYSVFLIDAKTQSPLCQPWRGTVKIP